MMPMFKLEHREHRGEFQWIACVFDDAPVVSVSTRPQRETEQLRIQAAPDTWELWWVDIDRYTGQIVAHSTGRYTPSQDMLQRIEAIGPDLVLAAAPLFADAELPVYIRFGSLPKGDRSRNWATGELEPGVSCYRARRRVDGGYMLAGPGLPYAAIDAAIRGDVVLLITGEECGRGSDGEPCLRNVRTLARLQYRDGRFVEL